MVSSLYSSSSLLLILSRSLLHLTTFINLLALETIQYLPCLSQEFSTQNSHQMKQVTIQLQVFNMISPIHAQRCLNRSNRICLLDVLSLATHPLKVSPTTIHEDPAFPNPATIFPNAILNHSQLPLRKESN